MTISAATSIGTNTGSAVNTVSITVGVGGVPAGALIIVAVAESSTVTTLAACADTAGNAYTRQGQSINGTGTTNLFRAWNVSALVSGNTITATLGATGKNAAISAFYLTGVQTSGDPIDLSTAGTQGNSTAPSIGPSAVPGQNGEVFVCAVGTTGPSTDTFTQDSSNAAYTNFPVRAGIASGSGPTIAGGVFVQGTAAALTFAPTLGTARNWGARLWTLKPSTATVLAAAQGVFTLTGEPVSPLQIAFAAAEGAFTLTGEAATFLTLTFMAAAQGSFTLTGEAATFAVDLVAAQGTVTETGEPVTFLALTLMAAAQGVFTETGQPAAFMVNLGAAAGTFTETGEPVVLGTIGAPLALVAQAGLFHLTGFAAIELLSSGWRPAIGGVTQWSSATKPISNWTVEPSLASSALG